MDEYKEIADELRLRFPDQKKPPGPTWSIRLIVASSLATAWLLVAAIGAVLGFESWPVYLTGACVAAVVAVLYVRSRRAARNDQP